MYSIKKMLYNLGIQLQQVKYLNRRIVFTIDLLLSGFASLTTFTILYRVVPALVSNISIVVLLGSSIFFSGVLLYFFRAYRIIIRHSTTRDLMTFFYVGTIKSVLLGWVCSFYMRAFAWEGLLLFIVFDAALTVFLLLMFRSTLVSLYYSLLRNGPTKGKQPARVLIYGVDEECMQLASGLHSQSANKLSPVGLLEVTDQKQKIRIHNLPVIQVADEHELAQFVKSSSIHGIVFVKEEMVRAEESRMVEWCMSLELDMYVMPMIERTSGEVKKHVREVHIEDLLGRERIGIETDKIESMVRNRSVFVTGAAGSIGSEIARQLCRIGVGKLVCYDNAETPLHNLELEIRRSFPELDVEFILGDVRSSRRVEASFARIKPEIVYHAAAYKHVPMIERNPCEAVLVNVCGTRNLAEMAIKYGVKRFVMISTDKAVRPTNVMGASKRLAEMYVQALNHMESCKTLFITTRFGNVLGSNGSVIPLFKEQISKGGPVTVTHPDITRYFMTIPEACRLVLQASAMGEGGEIFVFDMGAPVRIVDLAKRMIKLAGLKLGEDINIEFTGLRPGEKLYEELLTEQESTTETQHGKIRRALVSAAEFEPLNLRVMDLVMASRAVKIEESVLLLKELVPDFISNNSKFEELDKKKEEKSVIV